MSLKRESESLPLLLVLLQNGKTAELVRLMFNRKVSEQYLGSYGAEPPAGLGRAQAARVEDYVRRLAVQEVVQLKGSQSESVKHHCNTFLQEFLSRKLRDSTFTRDDRQVAWVQLTQLYQLQTLYHGLAELELPPDVAHAIRKDILRTHLSPELHPHQPPASHHQTELLTHMRSQLTQTLQRLAVYNPYIGYCQGMNTVLLFFLEQNFTCEQSFFLFKKISEELLPCDYYSSMESVITYVQILFEMLHHTHPAVVAKMKLIMKKMDSEGFMLTMSFVFQWFVCLFTNTNLQRSLRLIILDHFLLHGVTALFKAALAYFDVIEPAVQNVTCFEEYIPTVEKTIRQFSDEKALLSRLRNTYINPSILHLLREKLQNAQPIRRERQEKTACNHRWNTCLQAIENSVSEGRKHEFFIFRLNEEVKPIDNYLLKLQKQYFRICKNQRKSDQLRIGRMQHVCRCTSVSSRTRDYDYGSESKQSNDFASSANKSRSEKQSPHKSMELSKNNEESPMRKEFIRNRAMKKLELGFSSRQSVLNRSESVQFMRNMIQNESFSNLLSILEVEEMETLFKDDISEDD